MCIDIHAYACLPNAETVFQAGSNPSTVAYTETKTLSFCYSYGKSFPIGMCMMLLFSLKLDTWNMLSASPESCSVI